MISVEGAGRVLMQHVVTEPIAQKAGRAGIAVVGVVVAGFFLVENEADDVIGAAVVQSLLQGRVDDVVRWSDDVAQGADAAQVIPVSAKRANVGHGCGPLWS